MPSGMAACFLRFFEHSRNPVWFFFYILDSMNVYSSFPYKHVEAFVVSLNIVIVKCWAKKKGHVLGQGS